MRLPSIKTDYWELRSGQNAHAQNPNDFWIPPLTKREQLIKGQAARLIFDIEVEEEGKILVQGERMWVIVSEKIANIYIGILDNQPACLYPEENAYLRFGAEIPFLAEHIIDIANPPQDYVDWQLGQPPERVWPR